jgi:hypothetical protein
MAFTYESILTDTEERLLARRSQQVLELEAARHREDTDATRYAADAILAIDNDLDRLNRTAQSYINSMQPQTYGFGDDIPRKHIELAQRHGVSPDRIGVALNWTTDPNMSDEDKVRTYMENTRRLAHDRATGRYRDDQGSVKR